jgi:hypothetical protein
MEAYERETQEVIKGFVERRLSFADCIAALDAALAGLIPTLTGDEIHRLRVVMLANNEIVMKEMERRGAPEGPKSRLGVTKFKMGHREITILKYAQYTSGISGATEEEQSVLDSLLKAGCLRLEDPEFLPANTGDSPTYRLTPAGLAIAESGNR